MKTKFTNTLILLILTELLASCAPQTATPAAAPTSTPAAATLTPASTPEPTRVYEEIGVDAASLQGIQVRFLHPWTGETLKVMNSLVDQFNQTNEYGVHVIAKAHGSTGMVENQLREQGNNQNYANIVAAPVSLVLALNEKDGVVADLAPYVHSQQYGMDQELVGDFRPEFWSAGADGERQLGIPAQFSGLVMFSNTTWAGELGHKDIPETSAEFEKVVCAANASFRKDEDETNDGLGGWVINRSSESMYNWLTAFGAGIYADGAYSFDTPEAKDSLTYLRGLAQDACAWIGRNPRTEEYFALRETVVYTGWLQDAQNLAAAMTRAGSMDEWIISPFPGSASQLTLSSNLVYAVLQSTGEEDLAAWLFINWISQPQQQAKLLQTNGTYPLGTAVMAYIGNFAAAHPQWNNLVTRDLPVQLAPANADWQVVRPILEDGAWQLFNSESNPDLIPPILKEMDRLAEELSERYP